MGRLTQGTTNEPYIFHYNITNKFLNHKIKNTMNTKYSGKFEFEIIDDMLQWEPDKFYKMFGPWLEVVVEDQKAKIRAKLKKIWKDRKLYGFRGMVDSISDDTVLIYFDPKKIGKYTLHEMEAIIEKIENETILQIK